MCDVDSGPVISATVDNSMELYADGQQVSIDGAGTWETTGTAQLPKGKAKYGA